MAFSVKGDSVTLIKDCQDSITRKLDRESTSKISNEGLITVGKELIQEGFYNVSI